MSDQRASFSSGVNTIRGIEHSFYIIAGFINSKSPSELADMIRISFFTSRKLVKQSPNFSRVNVSAYAFLYLNIMILCQSWLLRGHSNTIESASAKLPLFVIKLINALSVMDRPFETWNFRLNNIKDIASFKIFIGELIESLGAMNMEKDLPELTEMVGSKPLIEKLKIYLEALRRAEKEEDIINLIASSFAILEQGARDDIPFDTFASLYSSLYSGDQTSRPYFARFYKTLKDGYVTYNKATSFSEIWLFVSILFIGKIYFVDDEGKEVEVGRGVSDSIVKIDTSGRAVRQSYFLFIAEKLSGGSDKTDLVIAAGTPVLNNDSPKK